MWHPECQQPPVKASSKEVPDRPLMRGDRCIWRPHLFFLASHTGRRFGLVTRRVASAVAREPADRLFGFYTIGWHGHGVLFSPLSGSGYRWLSW